VWKRRRERARSDAAGTGVVGLTYPTVRCPVSSGKIVVALPLLKSHRNLANRPRSSNAIHTVQIISRRHDGRTGFRRHDAAHTTVGRGNRKLFDRALHRRGHLGISQRRAVPSVPHLLRRGRWGLLAAGDVRHVRAEKQSASADAIEKPAKSEIADLAGETAKSSRLGQSKNSTIVLF
jgi:hypothetical protein